MHSSFFFRHFPPPKFMLMKHVGLHISDDSICFLEYGLTSKDVIKKFGKVDLPAGVVDSGNIVDEKTFSDILTDFDKKNDLEYAKISVPEESAYLFQTEVPNTDLHSIAQNIEFKLEENVPLSPADAVFYFDLFPSEEKAQTLRASVSVVPRAYIEKYISLLRQTGICPVAFEVVPKAIARAVIPKNIHGTQVIVNAMKKKTGIYVVSCGVVSFSSTISWAGKQDSEEDILSLAQEIRKVRTYWSSHSGSCPPISGVILAGGRATQIQSALRAALLEANLPVDIANVWGNSINLEEYIPPISKEDSMEYAASAGLAMFV